MWVSQRQMEITDGLRNEQLTTWHHACCGAGPWGWSLDGLGGGRGVLLWPAADIDSSEGPGGEGSPLRWWDFTRYLSSPVLVLFASLITSGSWRMLHFLAYFEHCSLSPSPRAGLQLSSCTPNSCSVVTVLLTPHQQSHVGVPDPSLSLPGPFSCFPCLFQLLPGSCLLWMYFNAKRDLRAWCGGEIGTKSILFFQ